MIFVVFFVVVFLRGGGGGLGVVVCFFCSRSSFQNIKTLLINLYHSIHSHHIKNAQLPFVFLSCATNILLYPNQVHFNTSGIIIRLNVSYN